MSVPGIDDMTLASKGFYSTAGRGMSPNGTIKLRILWKFPVCCFASRGRMNGKTKGKAEKNKKKERKEKGKKRREHTISWPCKL